MGEVAPRDQNYKAVIQGTSSTNGKDPTNIYVNPSTHAILVEATIVGGAGNPAAGPTGSAVPADADYQGINIGGILIGQTGFSVGTARAGAVAIVDGSGNQITSFGGGTQYTDGGVPPTHPIGGTIEWSDGSNWQTVSSTKPLPVTATIASVSATASPVPASATYIGARNASGNLAGANLGYNAINSAGDQFLGASLIAQFDDVSPSSVTENQFANVRINSARQLYAQNVQIDTFGTTTTFTITAASLASSTVGVGRQSTLVTGNTARSALVACKFTAGTSPTANTLVYVYLIRGDGTLNDDNAGASDAGITIINAPLLGTILVSAATSNATYYGLFDTKFLGSLGPTWGIAIVNSTGATANATAGNFLFEYTNET